MSSGLTIVLIDQHPVARIGLSHLLQQTFRDINLLELENTHSFHESFPDTRPDLVIVGFANTTMFSNLKAVRLISSCHGTWKIIVLDEKSDPVHAVSFLKAKARGYISKQDNNEEVVDCIKLVLDGKRYLGQNLIGQALKNLGLIRLIKKFKGSKACVLNVYFYIEFLFTDQEREHASLEASPHGRLMKVQCSAQPRLRNSHLSFVALYIEFI
jgi:DNA-binding NarL/FixJ family response regulator